ncbi:hypothetical protein [Cognatilysobacter segetis]|uniref:hypothetical protein n=1 Tax=Cognatilysobacter segetis TaxID=2492394 RepID=UPI0010611EE9|nr:hypothetical protein [Lysobacter segetis]
MIDPLIQQLKDALQLMDSLDRRRDELSLHVWALAKAAVPELDELGRQLWGDDQTGVAFWFCRPGRGESPAEQVAAGRAGDVIQQILRSLYGVYS